MTTPAIAVLAGIGLWQLSERLGGTMPPRRAVAAVGAALVVQFLWYLPFVRSVGEEAWAARADVAFAHAFVPQLPPNAIVLTHNPNMFHLWGQSAAQASIAVVRAALRDERPRPPLRGRRVLPLELLVRRGGPASSTPCARRRWSGIRTRSFANIGNGTTATRSTACSCRRTRRRRHPRPSLDAEDFADRPDAGRALLEPELEPLGQADSLRGQTGSCTTPRGRRGRPAPRRNSKSPARSRTGSRNTSRSCGRRRPAASCSRSAPGRTVPSCRCRARATLARSVRAGCEAYSRQSSARGSSSWSSGVTSWWQSTMARMTQRSDARSRGRMRGSSS